MMSNDYLVAEKKPQETSFFFIYINYDHYIFFCLDFPLLLGP